MNTEVIRQLIEDFITPKTALIALAAVLILLSYVLGLSHGETPREVMCSADIAEVSKLQGKLSDALARSHATNQRAQLECVKREQDVCAERMDTYRERLTALRCKICEAGAKP